MTYESLPTPIPASVRVGDTAQISVLNVYTDSTKSTLHSRHEMSYIIEQDTASTALFNLITKAYGAQNLLIATQQTRFRIASDGSLSLISIDLQYSAPSMMHLVMTKN